MHKPGDRVGGRYYILSYLGGGGFGQTYLAEDTHLPGNPLCVVKHLRPKLTDALSLETAERLFETEAQVLYKLNEYGQIPSLFAHFEENQEFYLVQEFIDGTNLSKELILGQPLSESQTIALLQEILEVLVFIHQQNVIHRDLKPSNLIRRQRDGKIVLIDFGAVKHLTTQIIQVQGHTTRTIAIGSPGYMPSEQMAGRPRFCSDLYAVGMIGIQAVTGLHPRDLPEDHQTSEIIWRNRAAVSPTFADIIDKMVRYDFRERYQAAMEVLLDLNQLLPQDAQTDLPISVTPSTTPVETRIQWLTRPGTDSGGLGSELGIDYTRLRDLLRAKSWREADQETQLLILKACGCEGGRLRVEDVRNFPCRDLHTIDCLWMDHSNGLFGFNAQKAVWVSVGGRTDASYEAIDRLLSSRGKWRVNSPWLRFGQRVGWRVRESWIPYDRYLFGLEAPKGHLPSWRVGGHIAALFSRMEVCRPYMPRFEITQQP